MYLAVHICVNHMFDLYMYGISPQLANVKLVPAFLTIMSTFIIIQSDIDIQAGIF